MNDHWLKETLTSANPVGAPGGTIQNPTAEAASAAAEEIDRLLSENGRLKERLLKLEWAVARAGNFIQSIAVSPIDEAEKFDAWSTLGTLNAALANRPK